MTEEEQFRNINWDTADGAYWASHDDDICRQYAGKWLVAVPGRVVASGDDPDVVGREAGAILKLDPATIVVRAITHPDEWFKDYPVYSGVPAPQSAG